MLELTVALVGLLVFLTNPSQNSNPHLFRFAKAEQLLEHAAKHLKTMHSIHIPKPTDVRLMN
jgi:hypothetical protein